MRHIVQAVWFILHQVFFFWNIHFSHMFGWCIYDFFIHLEENGQNKTSALNVMYKRRLLLLVTIVQHDFWTTVHDNWFFFRNSQLFSNYRGYLEKWDTFWDKNVKYLTKLSAIFKWGSSKYLSFSHFFFCILLIC